MSRFVGWGGKLWARSFFEPPLDLEPGTCPRCGGLGVVPESIDEERYEVAVPCPACRVYCKRCRSWITPGNHQCRESAK